MGKNIRDMVKGFLDKFCILSLSLTLMFTGITKIFSDDQIGLIFMLNCKIAFPLIFLGLWEIYLGISLIFRQSSISNWILLLLTFILFLIYNILLILQNHAVCNCFGVFSINPIWVAFFDLIATIYCFIKIQLFPKNKIKTSTLLNFHYIYFLFPVISIFWIIVFNNYNLRKNCLSLAGKKLTFDQMIIDFGSGKPGETIECSIKAANLGKKPIRLIGGTMDCNCSISSDFPIQIENNGTVDFKVQFRIPPAALKGQILRRTFQVFCAHEYTEPYILNSVVYVL